MKSLKELSEAKYKDVVNRHVFIIGAKAAIKELMEDIQKVPVESATGDFLKGQAYAYKAVMKTLDKLNED